MLLAGWLTRLKQQMGRSRHRSRSRRVSPLSPFGARDWLLEDRCMPSAFPTPTPSDPNAVYVNYVYEALLGRPADAGAGFWVDRLDAGTSPSAVVQGIEASTEYLNNVVNSLYEQELHRAADPAGLNAWTNLLQNGGTIEQVIGGLVSSPEYYANQGGINGVYVASLYSNILGRTGSPTEIQNWVNQMANGTTTAQVANAFLSSQEYQSNLIESYYQNYLGRPADAAGLASWLNQLNQGVPDQVALAAIVGSPERFDNTASFVYTDSFNRATSTNLGSNWSTVQGLMGISGDQAAGLSGSVDQAQVNGFSLTDTAVSVVASVGTGNAYAGVFARRDAAGNMYVAMLVEDSTKNPANTVNLYRYTPALAGTNGGWSLLKSESLPTKTTSADLELQVTTASATETSLQVYLNNTLALSWMEGDSVVSGVSYYPLDGPGGAGLLSIGAGTTYKDFTLFALPPSPAVSFVYADTFDRANATTLGSNWTTVQGQMGISSDKAAGLSGSVEQAQVNSFSLTDTAVSVLASVGTGNADAGVFARRDAAGNMYVAMLVQEDSTDTLILYRYTPSLAGTSNGWSILKSESLPTKTSTADLDLQVTGSGTHTSLQVYLNNALSLSWTEGNSVVSGVSYYPIDGPGSAGLLSIGAGTTYQDFNLFSLQPSTDSSFVYTDTFDRANATNLGSNWSTVQGEMGISGDQAAGLSGSVDQAQVNNFYLTDTAVNVLASVGSTGSRYAGVFARRGPSGNMYAAMLVEDGSQNPAETVDLYRYTPSLAGTNGGWSVLDSQVVPTPTSSADLELQVTGSGTNTSLQVYLNNTLALSWTEGDSVVSGISYYPLDGPGGAGLLSIGAGTAYQDFSLFSPQPPLGSSHTNASYVQNLYETLLGRPADAGAAGWVSLLDSGLAPSAVVQGIEASTEYLNNLVNQLYEQDLHRAADPAGLNTWTTLLQNGGTIEQVISGLVSSPEYYSLHADTSSGFVASLYGNILGRTGSSTEIQGWVSAMAGGTTPAQVANDFLTSQEYQTFLVESYYQNYLGRPADAAGLASWLGQLNQGIQDQVVLAAILGSPEAFEIHS